MIFNPPPRLLWAIAGMLLTLAVGSGLRWLALRRAPPDIIAARIASLKTWWLLALLLSAGLCIGQLGMTILFAAGSLLAVREYVTITGLNRTDRGGTIIVFCGTLANYAVIGAEGAYLLAPVLVLVLLGTWKSAVGRTGGYIRATAALFWGWALFAFAPAHALLLYTMPSGTLGASGPAGALLLLLLLTAVNDIAQALVGRRVGVHRITPRVSPGKTWEGLAGGVIVTTGLSLMLKPYLVACGANLTSDAEATGFFSGHWEAVLIGLLIAISGFFGDIDISAVKRDAGVKDGSTLLPGQGGMIDRIDSLTFTAPIFYYTLQWLCGE